MKWRTEPGEQVPGRPRHGSTLSTSVTLLSYILTNNKLMAGQLDSVAWVEVVLVIAVNYCLFPEQSTTGSVVWLL